MTVDELRMEKRNLQLSIEQLLMDFKAKTGVAVTGLDLESIRMTEMSGAIGWHVARVAVRMDIEH